MKITYLFLSAILFLGVQSAFSQTSKCSSLDSCTREYAANLLRLHEEQSQKITDPHRRLLDLMSTVPLAFAAGEPEKAKAFANELLAVGDELKNSPGFGASNDSEATFTANIVLGLIALDKNDVGKAKEHLLAAARVSGSPVLKSFGPSMLLAEKLIEKGERKTAIEYFDLCAKFWDREDGKLEKWKIAVEQGATPDFGVNLRVGLDNWKLGPPILRGTE